MQGSYNTGFLCLLTNFDTKRKRTCKVSRKKIKLVLEHSGKNFSGIFSFLLELQKKLFFLNVFYLSKFLLRVYVWTNALKSVKCHSNERNDFWATMKWRNPASNRLAKDTLLFRRNNVISPEDSWLFYKRSSSMNLFVPL